MRNNPANDDDDDLPEENETAKKPARNLAILQGMARATAQELAELAESKTPKDFNDAFMEIRAGIWCELEEQLELTDTDQGLREERPDTQGDKAERLLQNIMTQRDGIAVAELRGIAGKNGISWSAMARAKTKQSQVTTRKQRGGWYWSWPKTE